MYIAYCTLCRFTIGDFLFCYCTVVKQIYTQFSNGNFLKICCFFFSLNLINQCIFLWFYIFLFGFFLLFSNKKLWRKNCLIIYHKIYSFHLYVLSVRHLSLFILYIAFASLSISL